MSQITVRQNFALNTPDADMRAELLAMLEAADAEPVEDGYRVDVASLSDIRIYDAVPKLVNTHLHARMIGEKR